MLEGRHFHHGDGAQNTLFLGALSSEGSGPGCGSCRISDMLDAAASPISAIAVFIPNQVMTYSEDELTAGHTQALTRTFHPDWAGAQ